MTNFFEKIIYSFLYHKNTELCLNSDPFTGMKMKNELLNMNIFVFSDMYDNAYFEFHPIKVKREPGFGGRRIDTTYCKPLTEVKNILDDIWSQYEIYSNSNPELTKKYSKIFKDFLKGLPVPEKYNLYFDLGVLHLEEKGIEHHITICATDFFNLNNKFTYNTLNNKAIEPLESATISIQHIPTTNNRDSQIHLCIPKYATTDYPLLNLQYTLKNNSNIINNESELLNKIKNNPNTNAKSFDKFLLNIELEETLHQNEHQTKHLKI